MAWEPDYITTAELKAFVRVDDAVDDTELAGFVTTASRMVDNTCNRQFGKVDAPQSRRYTARYRCDRGRWQVDVDDLMSTTGVTVAVPDGTIEAYDLEPFNAAALMRPWTRLLVDPDAAAYLPTGEYGEVTMVAPWGWTAVPTAVKTATKLQASRLASRRDSPYGIAGSPEQGGELRLLAKVDPDVAVSLRSYLRARRPR